MVWNLPTMVWGSVCFISDALGSPAAVSGDYRNVSSPHGQPRDAFHAPAPDTVIILLARKRKLSCTLTGKPVLSPGKHVAVISWRISCISHSLPSPVRYWIWRSVRGHRVGEVPSAASLGSPTLTSAGCSCSWTYPWRPCRWEFIGHLRL